MNSPHPNSPQLNSPEPELLPTDNLFMDHLPTGPAYGVVLVTASTLDEAIHLARTLVTERLVACANYFPITSVYTWQGQLEQSQEYQLMLKTDLGLFEALQTRIAQLHTYEVPEIIALQIDQGSSAYLTWIGQSVVGGN
jgi:periplasmic divalent cation tolerance protein